MASYVSITKATLSVYVTVINQSANKPDRTMAGLCAVCWYDKMSYRYDPTRPMRQMPKPVTGTQSG